ncbi:MAG: ATP-binding protein [Lentisphaeria bacterium]
MKIAVASGKGGTGKTTVSLALAEVLGTKGLLLDCDVEEPNCHLFFQMPADKTTPVTVKIPSFNQDLCIGCHQCSDFCAFNAIANIGKKLLIFPELCHSCGGCAYLCPTKAIQEIDHKIGVLEYRKKGSVELITGIMDVGNIIAVPIIHQVIAQADSHRTTILDSPPGTACPMVNTIRDADFVILVTEPTPFGLYDLQLAQDTLEAMNIPSGVIINRADDSCADVEAFCKSRNIDVLMKIPFSKKIATGYSNGDSLLTSAPELKPKFTQLLQKLGGL